MPWFSLRIPHSAFRTQMRILRTYVLREHLAPFLATIGALTAALLVGHIIKFAELVIAKGVNVFDILRLLLYLVPYMSSFTIPMACLVAMILAFGRLSTDYELIAMRASGIAPLRLVFPIVMTGAVLSLLLLVINDRLIPESHLAFRKQLRTIGQQRPAAYIEAGTFIREFSPYTIFVYQLEGQKLLDVRIYEPQANGPTRAIIASRGEFESTPDRKGVRLLLYDGTADQWDPSLPGLFYKITFGSYAMDLRSDRNETSKMSRKLKEMSFHQLLQERQRVASEGIDTRPVSLEFHRRIASSFAALVFVVFGLALGLQLRHHERLVSFVWVFIIFLAYYLASIGLSAVGIKGWLPAWVAMWLPNVTGLGLGVLLVARAIRH